MASRKIEDLSPECMDLCLKFLERCKQSNIDILITCTYRSNVEQEALYAQGRQKLDKVNELRRKAGLKEISVKENNSIVTYARAGQSKHNRVDEYGNPSSDAFDVVPLEAGKAVWDSRAAIWQKVGKIGKDVGLEWAGDWKSFKEFPHFQYRRIEDAKNSEI